MVWSTFGVPRGPPSRTPNGAVVLRHTHLKSINRKTTLDPFLTTKPTGEGTGLGLSTYMGSYTLHPLLDFRSDVRAHGRYDGRRFSDLSW